MQYTTCQVYNETIFRLRTQSHLSQAALAEKAGISLTSLKNLETAPEKCFRIDTVRAVANFFGVETGELIRQKSTTDIDDNALSKFPPHDDGSDTILQEKITHYIKSNCQTIDELLDRYHQAYSSGQFSCSVSLYEPFMQELKLDHPLSMSSICNKIMSQMQAIASIPDHDLMEESAEVIHWVGNVLYTLPRSSLSNHIDRERLWTFVITSAQGVKFEDEYIQTRYRNFIENLTPARFSEQEERIKALLLVYYFLAENWEMCHDQPDSYITLSLICCLFEEDEPINENDLINMDRASILIFKFLYALERANMHKPALKVTKDD